MAKTLAFVHTSPMLTPAFAELAAELLPDVRTFHMVDESLIKNTIAAGSLTKATARRVLRLIESAQEAGADAILVTCSSIGAAVARSREFIDVPVLRVDEPMARAAVEAGPRIGVLATLRTTLEPTISLVRDTASALGRDAVITPCLCEGAFEAVSCGRIEEHDAMVRSALERLIPEVDVVVLAQASMARIARMLPAGPVCVLASPRLAVESAVRVLANGAE